MSLDETVPDLEVPAAAARWACDRTVADLPALEAPWRGPTPADVTPPDGVAPGASARVAGDVTPPDGIAETGTGQLRADVAGGGELASARATSGRRSLLPPRLGGNRLGRRPRSPVRALWIGAAALPIAVVAMASASSSGRSAQGPAPMAIAAGGPSAPALFDEALDAIRGDDWDEATILLERSAELDPSRDEVARYLSNARRELIAAGGIAEARRCLEESDAACAEAALGRVPPDSIVAERHAGELRDRLAAGATPDDRREDDAPSGTESGALDPSRVESEGGALERSAGGMAIAAASTRRPVGAAARRQTSAGGVRGAAAASDTGSASGSVGGAAAAARMVQAGVRARLADDLELAAERFVQALAVDPSNADARAELDAMRGRLPEIFRRAYARMEGDPERAARGMRLVARLSPAGDPLRGKAEKWLSRLPAGSGR